MFALPGPGVIGVTEPLPPGPYSWGIQKG